MTRKRKTLTGYILKNYWDGAYTFPRTVWNEPAIGEEYKYTQVKITEVVRGKRRRK